MNNIKIVKTDGTVENLEMEEQPTLEQMQKWVGGYVEKVVNFPIMGTEMRNKRFKEFYVNEDGRSMGLTHNDGASKIAGQSLVGNAVLLINFKWE